MAGNAILRRELRAALEELNETIRNLTSLLEGLDAAENADHDPGEVGEVKNSSDHPVVQ